MKLIDKIKKPEAVRLMGVPRMELLAAEIREFLVESVSKTGGHLASNLGVVELTIALYHCFDFRKDKLIWDVGHQGYVHKILTGRKAEFENLRKHGGISGFLKSQESPYDFWEAGHSSTSVSAGLGFAAARDLRGEEHEVISVIGDGSITSGLAFEAMNNAGRSKSNFKIILNDNEMSISPNVGALSAYLDGIRTARPYLDTKNHVKEFLDKLPVAGSALERFIGKTKDGIKYLLIPGVIFEELGFKYLGPVDGHNIGDLVKALEMSKNVEGPTLIHVVTKKGKGYAHAEASPDKFHGISAFDVKTGDIQGACGVSFTEVFGEELLALAEKDPRIVAITASMAQGTGLQPFAERFPERFFDVGIAEPHAATFAAGLAKSGMKPVFAVYSTFLQRAYDQISHDICLQSLGVVLAIDRAGAVGADGETHQGLFDLSFLGHMPNMTVMAPRNAKELSLMLALALTLDSPAAVRYPRADADDGDCAPLVLGKSELLFSREQSEILIISVGTMARECEQARSSLALRGVSADLINARFVSPIDPELAGALTKYKHVFTVEDNVASGGFGEKLAALASKKPEIIAFPTAFIEHGTRAELFRKYGLDGVGILDRIIKVTDAAHG